MLHDLQDLRSHFNLKLRAEELFPPTNMLSNVGINKGYVSRSSMVAGETSQFLRFYFLVETEIFGIICDNF